MVTAPYLAQGAPRPSGRLPAAGMVDSLARPTMFERLTSLRRPRPFQFVIRDPAADILVITNMWPESERPAYGIFIKRQVEGVRAAGARCDVLYMRGCLSKLVYPLGAVVFLAMTPWARRRYRLVHVHAGETALAARFLLAPRMIATYHGDDVLGYVADDGPMSLSNRVKSFVIRTHASLFTSTITQSDEMHSRLPRRAHRRSRVIRCGVDAEQFRPGDREAARRALGWSASERIVLFAATRPHEPLKRLDLARAAVAHAESALGPIRLFVAENQAPDLMPTLMNAADCLILTSMLEGSPMVVKEAILCNLPVVATDVADIGEMLADVDAVSRLLSRSRRVG